MTPAYARQSLGLSSIANLRELGGYVLPSSRRVRHGQLLRGGDLYRATDEDLAVLTDKYHLALDFDFRTDGEIQRCPDRVPEGVKFIHLPAIDPQTEKTTTQTLPSEAYKNLPVYLVANAANPIVQNVARHLYSDMVLNEYTQLQYAAFFQTILGYQGDGAIFWHCSQGKDRTGLGSAFLLSALGADRELVIYDYYLSMDYYQAQVDAVMKNIKTPEEAEVVLTFIGVNKKYFIESLDLINHHFGSMDAYLRGPLCLTEGDISALKDRFLE